MHNWNSDGRLEFIGEMTEEYKVDGIISEIVRFCTYNGWDKFDLKKQMAERGIPIALATLRKTNIKLIRLVPPRPPGRARSSSCRRRPSS